MVLTTGAGHLREDLDEIVSQFKFRELSIPTNGWESEQIVEKLKKINSIASGKLIVTLSLDGMQETHDKIRRPESFERTIQTFNELKQIKGLRIKFNTVLCEKNSDEIINLMHFVKELEPDFHSILMVRGTTRDPLMRLPSVDKIKILEQSIYRIQQLYNYGRTGMLSKVQRNYQVYKGDLNVRTLQERRQVIPCLAGASHLVVWPEGDVSSCELLPPIGNIREKNIDELLKGVKMKERLSSIRRGDCYCTHDCNMIENILLNPKSYLRLLR